MEQSLLPLVAASGTVLVAVYSLYLTYKAYTYKQRPALKMYAYLGVGHLFLAVAFGQSFVPYIGPFQAFPLFMLGVVLLFGAYTVKKNEIDA